MRRVKVAICDDLAVVRASLAAFLRTDPSLEVVGEYGSGEDLLSGLEENPADVVLLDMRMPGLDGHQVAMRLATGPARCRVAYITSYPVEIPLDDALESVVSGAISKDLAPDDLVRAVHLVASGTSLISPGVMRHYESRHDRSHRRESFARDEREREVLRLLCRGYTNDQIARELNRSSSSVKQILSAMCRRAGVASRTELVLYVLEGGTAQ